MASKRAVRRKQCGTKAKYEKKAALDRATEMSRFRKTQSFDAYPCSSCGSWHIGHRPAYVQREINHRKRSA